MSRDLVHRGEVVARAAPDGATYCCGVTFEVFFRAHGHRMASWSAEEVRALIAEWFCPVMGHAGAVQALVSRGMADPIPPADARPGDLCQFWRRVDLASPSGHSVLFLGWGASSSGARTLRYWSSQPATDGVGPHEEEVGDGWQIHLARVRASEGDDDARFLGSDRRPATPG